MQIAVGRGYMTPSLSVVAGYMESDEVEKSLSKVNEYMHIKNKISHVIVFETWLYWRLSQIRRAKPVQVFCHRTNPCA
jgi:hypothetical protein